MFDDFYGLSGRPFQLTPDPSFYFESASHQKALSYLGYGMAQGEGFIVITGEVGAGKSTLVAHLMQKIDPAAMSVGQIVTSNLDGEALVHVAAQSFGLEIDGHDKAGALGALENFLHAEAREGRRCLLVVDESQNLSIEALEELRMLSNFQLGAHPLLQILLLGQPEFRQILANHTGLEQLRQRVIASHHLAAMDPAEIEPYVMHRLKCVGWNGNPEFEPEFFAQLYDAAGGIPRRVNQIASRVLLLGAVEQCRQIDAAMLLSVLDEMNNDNGSASAPALPETADEPVSPPVATGDIEPALPSSMPSSLAAQDVAQLLAARDVQIAELQQAVVELSNAQGGDRSDAALAGTARQIAALQDRLDEQERTVRHVLTMLIEWIETGEKPRVAA